MNVPSWNPWLLSHSSSGNPPTLVEESSGLKNQIAPNWKRRRPRKVSRPPSSGYCRTCRRRRVKCDEQRPLCQRCRSAGHQCEGYDSWEVDVKASLANPVFCPENICSSTLSNVRMSGQAIDQTQLFADFLWQHYRKKDMAAPAPAHIMSFLHYLAGNTIHFPLLNDAIGTLCWAHLARKSDELTLIHKSQDSQMRLLSLVKRAVAQSESGGRLYSHRDVLATILIISLIPSPVSGNFSIHFNGATQYLDAHGPSAFVEGEPFDLVLLRHIRMQAIFQHLGRRKEVLWNRPEWRMVDILPFAYIPASVMSGFVTRLPGLLERADNLMASCGDHQEAKILVRTLDDIQIRLVQPWLAAETCARPYILDNSNHKFATISNLPRAIFYEFSKPSHGFCNAYVHLMALVADCTLLQLMHYVCTPTWMPPGSTLVRIEDVERRAYASASELCRYAYFFGSRSLPAVILLRNLLEAARNFFECYGKWEDVEWCDSCLAVVTARLESIRLTSPYTICPVGNFIASVPAACRYGPRMSLPYRS